jgi:hypothetical protein
VIQKCNSLQKLGRNNSIKKSCYIQLSVAQYHATTNATVCSDTDLLNRPERFVKYLNLIWNGDQKYQLRPCNDAMPNERNRTFSVFLPISQVRWILIKSNSSDAWRFVFCGLFEILLGSKNREPSLLIVSWGIRAGVWININAAPLADPHPAFAAINAGVSAPGK